MKCPAYNFTAFFCSDLLSDNLPCGSPPGRFMHTMNSVSDQTLFVYGGLGMDGKTLSKSD